MFLEKQKDFFHTNKTKAKEFRVQALKKLKRALIENEEEIKRALYKDLRKHELEAYASEIGICIESINYAIKHIDDWMKPRKVKTPIHQPGSKSFIYKEPYGSVLIIGPFNYPLQLVIEPLIGVISAGNTAIIKPSEDTLNTAQIIKKIIEENFEQEYIHVVRGGREVTTELLKENFDYIFFTGSEKVGKIVMEAASKNLTPVTLELGGKSPCIVYKDADVKNAAERIVWGKFLNAGQTCVAPDYILAHKDIKRSLIEEMKSVIINFYGKNPRKSESYGRVVSKKHFERLVSYLNDEKVIFGGDVECEDLYISPTLMDFITWEDEVMQDEVFGPILPIMEFEKLGAVIEDLKRRPKPLALYVFTESEVVQNSIIENLSYGGGCINDTLTHITNPYLPFGGVGSSGLGAYHGRHSFDTFSHTKTVLKKHPRLSIKSIYPPYNLRKLRIIKKFLG